MSKPPATFIYKFHHLDGITIGERRKEIFLLLEEYSTFRENESDLDYILKNLKPTNYLEQKFLVDVLIYFRRYSELMDLFRGENEQLMRQLWKQKWFFKRLLEENTADFIVHEVFKDLSFVTRIRFLKNIILYTRDEAKVDELYDFILLKYGSINANQVVCGCSLNKILMILKEQKFKICKRELLFLHKNKREYIDKIMELENSGQIFDFYDANSKALTIMAGSDFDLFFNIFKNNWGCNIGKKLTKKLMKRERSYIISRAAEIRSKLHERTLLHMLKSDFKQFFFQTFPKSFKTFRLYPCYSLMRYYPREKYLDLIQEGLQEVYGESISNHPELIDENILESTKDVQIRESLLEIRMKYKKDDYTLPQYYGIEKSIPILKKKISASDGVKTRENLIVALVNTCKINNSLNALLEVQKYFNSRHKNDDQGIRNSFIDAIENSFDLTQITEEHWKYIMELIKLSKIKNETIWNLREIYIQYIRYFKKNNATREHIESVIMSLMDDLLNLGRGWNILQDFPELEKYCLFMFMNAFEAKPEKEKESTEFYFEMFEAILDWNKRHPEDFINFCEFPLIKESVKMNLKNRKTTYNCSSYMNQFLTDKIPCYDVNFLNEIKFIFWSNFSENFDLNMVEFYLKKNPSNILLHFDTVVSLLSKQYLWDSCRILNLLKHYDHLGLPEKMVNYLKQNKMKGSVHGTVGYALAILMEPSEYLKMIQPPKAEKLNLEDDESSNYSLVNSLVECTKYLSGNSALPLVVEFCKGDYLHHALTPLYHYFFHSAEKHLLQHLQTLSTRAVSVRKHAVKLACSVSPVEIIYTLIKEMTDTEKNQSAIEHLFKKTFKYFLIDHTEEFWSLVETQIRLLDILESPAFKDVCSIKKIPKNYKLSYLNLIWELLDEKEKQGHDVSDFKEDLIKSLDSEVIKELPYEFNSNLIKEKFLRFEQEYNRTAGNFALACLKYSQKKELILKDIFNILGEFKKNYILHPEFSIACKSRSYVECFVSNLYYDFLDDKHLDYSVIESIWSLWTKLFSPEENIRDYIKLSLLVQLKQIDNLEMYASKISELFNTLVTQFGIHGIVECFTDALNHALPQHVFGSDNNQLKLYKLALKLLELKDGVNIKLFVIDLLPREISENKELEKMFFSVIDKLKKSNDKAVKINLDLFLTSLPD